MIPDGETATERLAGGCATAGTGTDAEGMAAIWRDPLPDAPAAGDISEVFTTTVLIEAAEGTGVGTRGWGAIFTTGAVFTTKDFTLISAGADTASGTAVGSIAA